MSKFAIVLVSLFMFACGGEEFSDNVMQNDSVLSVKENVSTGVEMNTSTGVEMNTSIEMENYAWKQRAFVVRPTITIEVSTTCGYLGAPRLELYDVALGKSIVTYDINTPQRVVNIKCSIGTKLCWGAWMGQKGYYDCSRAEETGSCHLVKNNPEYYSWGCGRDCDDPRFEWCFTCDTFKTGIYLNCGM